MPVEPWARNCTTDGPTVPAASGTPTDGSNLTRVVGWDAYTRAVPRLMLLDAHSLIYRAYFALIETPLSTSKGQLVNAAFGFWSIVLRGFQDAKPDHVVCCFDVGRPKRAERYQAYKGTRRPTPDDLREQFPIVRETLAAFRIPTFDLIHKYGHDYKVIVVGDAAMSPYEIAQPGGSVEHWNEEAGAVWLNRLTTQWPNAVWLNPMEERHWGFTHSVGTIRRLFGERMFPLTLAGLEAATRQLSRKH